MLALTACQVDLDRGTVLRPDGSVLALTTRERDLLRYLVDHPGRLVPRSELLAEVWGYADVVVSRACDNAIRRLREKVEADPAVPDHIVTVHGTGYRFVLGSESLAVPAAPARVLLLGALRVDLARLRVYRGDRELEPLTQTEAAVLEALSQAGAAIVTREALARAGWGKVPAGSRVVDSTVHRLRTKLEEDPAQPSLLLTVPRRGYRLVVPPVPPQSALIGRAGLVGEVQAAIGVGRWVLLSGPAGVGKSSLARAVADQHAGEVVWVDLAMAETPQAAAQIIAQALAVDLGLSDPVERVAQALERHSAALVVLDNLEGIRNTIGAIERWTGGRVALLGTSRVRVGAANEVLIEVPPLDTDAAVALFVRRAVAASSLNRDIVTQRVNIELLVKRLECMPLAIELAAARTPVLGVADLLAHLRLDLLVRTGGAPRHRSLRSVIEATLRSLPVSLLEALHDLALLRSAFFVDDAQGLLGDDAIDVLQALRDHSLLATEPGPVLRFRVWQAVVEVLLEVPTDPARTLRHARWFARWGEEAVFERLLWAGTEALCARIRSQVDELVWAAGAAADLGAAEVAAGCASVAAWVYEQQGPYAAGRELLARVLDESQGVPNRLRARLYLQRGNLERFAGADPEPSWREAVRRAEAGDVPWIVFAACGALARQCRRTGRVGEVIALSQQAATAADRWSPTSGGRLWMEANVAERQGNAEAQRDCLERALALADKAGNTVTAGHIATQVCEMALGEGRHPRARSAATLAYERFEAFDLRTGMALAAVALADTVLRQRDHAAAAVATHTLRHAAARVDSPLFAALAGQLTARSCLLSGDLDGATAALRQAEAAFHPPPPLLDAQTEEIWVELGCWRKEPAFATAHAVRSFEGYLALTGRSHAAAVMGRAAAAWLLAGDLPRARALLDRSSQADVPVLPARLAAEALVARAEGDIGPATARFAALRAELGADLDDEAVVVEALGPWAAGTTWYNAARYEPDDSGI